MPATARRAGRAARFRSFHERFLADRDLTATLSATVLFSFSLGISMLVLPLVALNAHYSAGQIGILTASAAIGQIVTRLVMVPLTRRFSDRFLVQVGCCLLCISALALIGSPSIPVFFACEILQGAARGFVWTSSKTHMVRRGGPSLPRLAANNLVTSVGGLSGPLVGGFVVQWSLNAALILCAGVATAAVVATTFMARWEHAQKAERASSHAQVQPVWRISGVRLGALAALTSAGWLGLMNGYTVTMLHGAGYSSGTIGLMITLGNLGSVIGGTIIFRVQPGRMVFGSGLAAAVVASGIVLVAAGLHETFIVVPAIVLSGIGSGALQTFAYALAADAVPPERRSDAVVSVGLSRAVSLLTVPLAAAGVVQVMAVPAAVAVTGVALSAPVFVSSSWRSWAARRSGPAASRTDVPARTERK